MSMTTETLALFCQRHFVATARSAALALRMKKLADMQQRAEGVSDYPQDIVRRIAHALQEPIPVVPPLPADFPMEVEGEDARGFAMRCLTITDLLAKGASSLTDLRELQAEALKILAFGDAAESRLRIAVREARELRASH